MRLRTDIYIGFSYEYNLRSSLSIPFSARTFEDEGSGIRPFDRRGAGIGSASVSEGVISADAKITLWPGTQNRRI